RGRTRLPRYHRRGSRTRPSLHRQSRRAASSAVACTPAQHGKHTGRERVRINRVKRVLGEGGVVLGTMVFEFASSGIGRIIATSGADFAIFDMEHSGWSTETIKSLFASCNGTDLVRMARVPATQYHMIA